MLLPGWMDKSMQYSRETDWLVYHKYLQWGGRAYCREMGEGSWILQRQRQGEAACCRQRDQLERRVTGKRRSNNCEMEGQIVAAFGE